MHVRVWSQNSIEESRVEVEKSKINAEAMRVQLVNL